MFDGSNRHKKKPSLISPPISASSSASRWSCVCAPHRHVLCKDEARRIAANIAKLPLVAPTAGVIEV